VRVSGCVFYHTFNSRAKLPISTKFGMDVISLKPAKTPPSYFHAISNKALYVQHVMRGGGAAPITEPRNYVRLMEATRCSNMYMKLLFVLTSVEY
jgi:hypothetical protein